MTPDSNSGTHQDVSEGLPPSAVTAVSGDAMEFWFLAILGTIAFAEIAALLVLL